MSEESNDRHARLGSIVKTIFPKIMQRILKECISPRGLQVKYQLKNIPTDFTESEISLMEKLPNLDDFTIELCFKILRYEHLLHEPSCLWGNVPHNTEIEIGDDVQRIINASNDVIRRKSEEISQFYYEEFQNRIQEVVKRVDTYLCQDTCSQLYQSIHSSDINTHDMLLELNRMQKVNVTNIVDEESEKLERYSRVSRVIIDTFPNILRDIVRSNISASKLYQMCLSHQHSFSTDQKASLNDLQSSKSYESMDITLIYKLLRQFSLIDPPTNGWGSNPNNVCIKLADDVERIRHYRIQLAHRCDANIGKDEFDDFFDKCRAIGVRMDLFFFQKRNYERLIIRHKTCSMDMQMQIKYKNALKELENIKCRFEKRPMKFFWGDSFDKSLRNLRSMLKNEKLEGRHKVRIQIILQNEDDVESTIDILNSLKDNINEGLSGIEFIVATKGSIVLIVDIPLEMMETDELFHSTLTLFLRTILERISIYTTESIIMVLTHEEEYTQWNVPTTVEEPVYLDFDIEAQFLENDNIMADQLEQISNTLTKHLNGNGSYNSITATLLPICLENVSNAEAFSQAQTPVKYNLPVSVTFRQQLSITLSKNEALNIYDCLKVGNMLVFTDYNYNKLMLCNADSTDLHHISVSYTPHYITKLDNNTVAVSCYYNKTILIINISKGVVTSRISTSDLCRGISYNDNNLYVVIGGCILHVMNLTGKIIRTIPLPSDTIFDITVDRDRLVFVEYISIYCCSLDGNLIWKFANEKYQDFRRVTTDSEGNVYVTDLNTNTVVVVSADGRQYREILTESNGLNCPRGIYFEKPENVLVVCNRQDGQAFLFDVKETNVNDEHFILE